MPITCVLRKAERWAVRQAMSSLFRYAGDTIARFIALAMKLHGGKKPILIRPFPLARCGYKRIRW
jgi:hypothetical protein